MSYRLTELVRNNLVTVVADWLDSDRQIFALYVDRIRGKGQSLSRSQALEFEAALLDDVSAEYLIDQIVDAVGESGTRFELRLAYANEDGSLSDSTPAKKRFNLVPEAPGTRTGSKGPDAATERLSQSLSQGFDTLIARNDESQQRTLEALKGNTDQMERFFETLLQLQAEGSNTATTQAIALAQSRGEVDMANFKLEMVLADQETSIGSLFVQVLPELLASPLVGNLAQLVGAMAHKVNEQAASLNAGDAAPEITPPAPEPAPAPPEEAGPNG